MSVPALFKSVPDLCKHLGIGANELEFLLSYSHYRYTQATIPKRRGGTRQLLVPVDRMKTTQRKLLPLLEEMHKPRTAVHGFVKDRSAKTNADLHQKRAYLLNVDLKDFFPSISRRRVAGLLNRMGLDQSVVDLICAICVTQNQLPQGAPTSPILANMISYRLDTQLLDFAKKNRLRYTRFADDISFSSYVRPIALFKAELPPAGRVPPDYLSTAFVNSIVANGFQINHDKIWFSDAKSRREVTGLIVNEFTNVRRKFIRNVRATLHKIQNDGVAAAQADHQAKYKHSKSLENIVRGQIEWIAQIRGKSFDPYRKYAKKFNTLFPSATPLEILPKFDEIADRAVWIIDVTHGDECFQGTAVFLDGIGLVTAEHVLVGLPVGSFAELYHPSAPAIKYQVSPSPRRCVTRDLAILDHTIPAAEFLSLPVATYPTRNQDPILAVGFADFGPGDEVSKRGGQVNAHATKHAVKLLEVSAILTDGMSGGPVLNEKHEVVGIVHKGGNQEHKQLATDVLELIKLADE